MPESVGSGPCETAFCASQLRSRSPLRRPDWRWLRARATVQAGRPPDRKEDPLVHKLICWLCARETALDRQGIWPSLEEARAIYEEQSPAVGLRPRLEGYLLAGEGDGAVAGRVGLSAAVVGPYKAAFFDVGGRLSDPATLWHFVPPDGEVREDDRDRWMRILGLLGGPYVLEAYERYLKEPPPEVPRDLEKLSDDELKKLLGRLQMRRMLITMYPAVEQSDRFRWHMALELIDIRKFHEW